MSLQSTTLSVPEGDEGDATLISVCLQLVDIHDGLQRQLHFNVSIAAVGITCRL